MSIDQFRWSISLLGAGRAVQLRSHARPQVDDSEQRHQHPQVIGNDVEENEVNPVVLARVATPGYQLDGSVENSLGEDTDACREGQDLTARILHEVQNNGELNHGDCEVWATWWHEA